jgi:hypothetical protein
VFNNRPWKRHTLISDIPVRQNGNFEASPGTATAFQPLLSYGKNDKPYIMVAGDGSQEAFYLTPTSTSVNSFDYEAKTLYDCKSVVGGIGIADVDDDGFVEVFIPCYYSGKVALITLEA